MSQQINLVNPALRPKKEWLTAAHMAWAVAAFAVLLFVYGGYLNLQASRVAAQREDWARRLQDAQARLLQLTRQYPVRQPSPTLQHEIAAAEQALQQRQKVLEVLESGVVGMRSGFSGLMQAFAHVGVTGLWLTGFSANGRGDEMRINGRALSPDLIPRYIGRLSSEQVLRGRSFSGLQVSQPPPLPAAAPAGQQKAPAAPLAFVEFSLSADKPAQEPAAGKDAVPAVTGTKS